MSEPTPSEGSRVVSQAPFVAYVIIAIVSSAASLLIALIAFSRFTQVSGSGMWAIAFMVFTPAILAVGVSFFVYKTSVVYRTIGSSRFPLEERGRPSEGITSYPPGRFGG